KETLHRCRPIVWLEISNATLDQIATKGGLQTITPPDYSLHKFVSRARFGVVHRMTIERCADMNPRDEGDYILVPNDWN
ncbi:MAG TPA: hypothetical protein VFL92_00685, partial [Sphingomonas sp.]|nr:hypothetical protein [Sphingomonas sp.]